MYSPTSRASQAQHVLLEWAPDRWHIRKSIRFIHRRSVTIHAHKSGFPPCCGYVDRMPAEDCVDVQGWKEPLPLSLSLFDNGLVNPRPILLRPCISRLIILRFACGHVPITTGRIILRPPLHAAGSPLVS